MMVAQFDKEMQSSGIAKTVAERNLPLRDVVNMASMVELEAVFAEEQPKIAGVFLKRVAIGMLFSRIRPSSIFWERRRK